MNYSKEFVSLGNLLGYFPQFWTKLYVWQENNPDFESIIRKFKTQEDSETVNLVLQETKKLLNSNLSEQDLDELIEELSTSGFSPLDTHREFFEKILIILEEPTEVTEKHFIPEFIG